jgi:prepilin-type N-terminal cleavage/methylation domain-containing protein
MNRRAAQQPTPERASRAGAPARVVAVRRSVIRGRGFTLIELLVVIGIMGLLAAITVPALKNFKKADAGLSATRQLLADVGFARQMAIAHRTTVYLVFCPSNFWNDPAYNRLGTLPAPPAPAPSELQKSWQLFDKQITGYAFVTLREVGDQPGRMTPRYHGRWRTLPEGVFIAPFKFNPPGTYTRITDPSTTPPRYFDVYGFDVTNNIPFPSEAAAALGAPYVTLPFVAFNSQGQLDSGRDEFIPLARGSVVYARDQNGVPQAQWPVIIENPPGNSTNAFNLIHIDWLTGRARLERQEISGQ